MPYGRAHTQALKPRSEGIPCWYGLHLQVRLEEVDGEYRAGKTTAALSFFIIVIIILWCQHACR